MLAPPAAYYADAIDLHLLRQEKQTRISKQNTTLKPAATPSPPTRPMAGHPETPGGSPPAAPPLQPRRDPRTRKLFNNA
jgi:hypothetical protein